MADRRLTTRDLTQTSDTNAPDAQANSKQEAPRDPLGEQVPDNRGGLGEPTSTDEPLARERSARENDDRPLSERHAGVLSRDRGASPRSAERAQPEHRSLLPNDQSERFTTRWQEIQASFVDQPRESVEQADTLVADLMQRLATSFSNERERLEAQWDRGDDVSTEDLRVALTRYRSFFDRLLSA